MTRALLLFSALLAATGCDEEFTPETVVDSLRVLGMRASPAELIPGETAVLSALVVDPSRAGKTSILWLGCDPDPLHLGRSACSDTAVLSDLGQIAGPSDGGQPQLPPGMHFIGFNERAAYSAPKDLFANLASDDPRRRSGSVAQVLAIVIAEELSPTASPEELQRLFERVKAKEVRSLLVLFRIRVSEERPANQNPVLERVSVRGEAHPPGATVRVRPAETVELDLHAPDSAFEEYEQLTPEGTESKTERLLGAWYSSWGRFEDNRVALGSGTLTSFTAPGNGQEPLPENRAGSLWAVVRDTRGGQTWDQLPLWLCDESLPDAFATELSISADPASGTLVTLRGTGLEAVQDVLVGERPLAKLAHSPARGVLEGLLPALGAGHHPVKLALKSCRDVETALFVDVP